MSGGIALQLAQVASPNGQGKGTTGAMESQQRLHNITSVRVPSVKVMTGSFDDNPNVAISSPLHRRRNLAFTGGIHDVLWHAAGGATPFGEVAIGSWWQAGIIGIDRVINRLGKPRLPRSIGPILLDGAARDR